MTELRGLCNSCAKQWSCKAWYQQGNPLGRKYTICTAYAEFNIFGKIVKKVVEVWNRMVEK